LSNFLFDSFHHKTITMLTETKTCNVKTSVTLFLSFDIFWFFLSFCHNFVIPLKHSPVAFTTFDFFSGVVDLQVGYSKQWTLGPRQLRIDLESFVFETVTCNPWLGHDEWWNARTCCRIAHWCTHPAGINNNPVLFLRSKLRNLLNIALRLHVFRHPVLCFLYFLLKKIDGYLCCHHSSKIF